MWRLEILIHLHGELGTTSISQDLEHPHRPHPTFANMAGP
jgi:hypothetical protein